MSSAQALLRTKWPELSETTLYDSAGSRNIVAWLKQASIEVRHASSQVSKSKMGTDSNHSITIIHFNDVYNVDAQNREPVGGAPRFSTAIKSLSNLHPLILFSGDAFSPSVLSTFTKGEHMSHVLNELGIQCSVFGNHEFDFGLEVLADRLSETHFPWLMSNVIDNETGRPLGDGKITHAVEWNGKLLGLIGLVEQEWLDTLATVNIEEVTFLDYVDAAQKLGKQLKDEGCDYVIALTHMRTPNDIRLAENTTEIDLILGGHDHVSENLFINGKHIVKSGTDFRQFSKISLDFSNDVKDRVKVESLQVTSEYAEDLDMKNLLQKYNDLIAEFWSNYSGYSLIVLYELGVMIGKMSEVLGTFSVQLEGRFCKIRTEETNLGNWVCDVLLAATGADVVMINSGTFRSDKVYPEGDFTLGDLVNLLPMQDPTVILSVRGDHLLAALENSVSMYPKTEGRFPQVAGISFAFDPEKQPGQRVEGKYVKIGDEYLVTDQYYKLATKAYLYQGCDGYCALKNASIIVGYEMSPELTLTVQNHFAAIKMRQGKMKSSKHRQSLVTLSRRHSLVKQLEGSDLDGPSPLRPSLAQMGTPSEDGDHHHSSDHQHHIGGTQSQLQGHIEHRPLSSRRTSFVDLEQETCLLAPCVESRIIKLTPEIRKQLDLERITAETNNIILEEPECDAQDSPKHDSRKT